MTTESKPAHGAKTLFWYLSLFFLLGIVAFSTGGIWFQLINKYIPQAPTAYGAIIEVSQSLVKSGLAGLLVGMPVFFFLAWLIRKAISRHQIVLDKGARLWVTYLILFIVVVTAIGDIITAVWSLLNGDFTLSFSLKCLTILVITGWIFSYFWLSIRASDALQKSKLPYVMGGVAAAVMILTIIAGFTMIDSPATARLQAYDQNRVNQIQQITYAVDSYVSLHDRLPTSTQDLVTENFVTAEALTDVVTKQVMEYRVIDAKSYELCAVFDLDAKDNADTKENFAYPGGQGQIYLHGDGRQCFTYKPMAFQQPGMEIK